MSKIRILSDHVANQIAAGEVVERPASVVKELVENSLDAGASRVSVDIEGAGVRLIRIHDNGGGMDEDDVLLSLERHATSKLHEEKDLASITTLGFRGEALPSIGSVAKMTLLSRPEHSEMGTRAEMQYGRLTKIHEDGCSRGTLIEIRNLFGNVPARKKFLKTQRTELFHIEEVIRNQALSHWQVEFALHVDGKQSLLFPKAAHLKERFRQVYRYQDLLLKVATPPRSGDIDTDAILLEGFLLAPDAPETRTARLRIFVNNRPVRDRMITHAVREGLHGFLMKGRQPAGVLLVRLPMSQVDINVHPAKQEIKFRSPQDVHSVVTEAVELAIADYQQRLKADIFVVPEKSNTLKKSPANPAQINNHSGQALSAEPISERYEPQFFPKVTAEATPEPYHNVPTGKHMDGNRDSNNEDLADSLDRTDRIDRRINKKSLNGLTLIGQCFDLYLFFEKHDELIVVDQHAAHERILYEQLRSAFLSGKIASQILLFPKTIELPVKESEIFARYHNEIADLGFGVEPFGDETFVIKAVPALLGHLQPDEIFFDVLSGMENGRKGENREALAVLLDNQLASMACKAAVKAGNRLVPEEMIALLEQMWESPSFSHCPHGRPVIKVFTQDEMKKWFYRT